MAYKVETMKNTIFGLLVFVSWVALLLQGFEILVK